MIILITGARSGLGRAVAIEAARRGHTVYGGLRDVGTASDLIDAAGDLDVRPLQLDVTSAIQRTAAVEQILAEHGHLDVLINNAGTGLGGFLEDVEEDELRALFDVNVIGAWGMTQAVLPSMRDRRQGLVVQISSVSGRLAFPGAGAYAMSKFALRGMTEAWRHEARLFGVRMMLVEPGAFRTDIWTRNLRLARRAKDPASAYAAWSQSLEDFVTSRGARTGDDPSVFADELMRRIESPRSSFRWVAGRDAKMRVWLADVLPDRVQTWVVGTLLRRLL
jgi:NAD(P)-dependent dehydrogenase (short-subunit alcohol dehydrogenase family)